MTHECKENDSSDEWSGYKIEQATHGTWFMEDKSGQNYYAIRIVYCPYCGVKL